MTNYEKIKSMSVDEMVDYINNNYKCEKCAYHHKCCDGECKSGIREWLESEAEPNLCEDKKNNLRHCEDCYLKECES